MVTLDQSDSTELRRTGISREGRDRALFRQAKEQNIGNVQRVLMGIAGLAMARFAVRRPSVKGKLILGALGGGLIFRAVTGYSPVYKALGISTAQQHPARAEDYFKRGIHVETSYLLTAPPEKLYAFWRELSNLPIIMSHLIKVEELTATRSRWTAAGPAGRTVSWEAEIIHDVPNELISWKSVGRSDVENAGTVRFTARGDGRSEVRVILDYIPPAGRLGKLVAQLFGKSPEQTIKQDLERFKAVFEVGAALGSNGKISR